MFQYFLLNYSLLFVLSFSLFCILIISSILVIMSVNTVYSVLYLIFVFFNAALILLIVNAEYIALMFLIIYVGAIAVLFLFVIMMLNIKVIEIQASFMQYLPLAGFIGLLLLVELWLVLDIKESSFNGSLLYKRYISITSWLEYIEPMSNIQKIGYLLFVRYYMAFLLSSIILLIAMIGSIILALDVGMNVRRQLLYKQMDGKLSLGNLKLLVKVKV